jgi:hypothetical protein
MIVHFHFITSSRLVSFINLQRVYRVRQAQYVLKLLPFNSLKHTNTEENNDSTPFDFTDVNMKEVNIILSKYPPGYSRGAMIPLLHLAQEQFGGWLPLSAMNKIAKMLDLPPIRVYEVASFYTMFNRCSYFLVLSLKSTEPLLENTTFKFAQLLRVCYAVLMTLLTPSNTT